MDEIKSIPLDDLRLDNKNPRIHQDISENITQVELAKFIYDNFGISDLKDSLLKNGYFTVEPMVVIPAEESGKYIVLEGNRRLTAIKILCKCEYREKIVSLGKREDFKAPYDLVNRLSMIPVVRKESRDSVNAYLGVRHLEGVIKWEPLAQSKYVYNQIIKEKERSSISIKESMEQFTQATNNKPQKVRNFFYKYCIYQCMQRLIEEDRSLRGASLDNKFSLLEVAMTSSGKSSIAKYIGINGYNRLDPEDYEDIIPEDNKPQTKNIIKWVFSQNPPIRESREINTYLKPILKNSESTRAFENGEDREDALLLSDTYDNIVKKSIRAIHKSLTDIQKYWSFTKPNNREDLKKLYKTDVLEKVEKTNKTVL